MESLTDIGCRHGTDKVDGYHTLFGRNYMEVYEMYFEPLRNKPIRILEIGVLNGGSFRSWRDYFPNAEVHGMDIHPSTKKHEDADRNMFIHLIDCSSDEKLALFAATFPDYFDIILDDGSHINSITKKTFEHLYPCLKNHGYYIIEDLGCAYIGDDLPKHLPSWPGTERIENKETQNDPAILFKLYNEFHTSIDLAKENPKYNFEFMHHYPYIMILKKNELYKPKN